MQVKKQQLKLDMEQWTSSNWGRNTSRLYIVTLFNLYTEGMGVCQVASVMSDFFDSMDCSLPGSSVHGILQARKLEWVAMHSSRGSSRPKDWTCLLKLLHCRQILYCWATWKALYAEYVMDWRNHKLELRLPREISTTSDIQTPPPLRQKAKRNEWASWWEWKRRLKKLG